MQKKLRTEFVPTEQEYGRAEDYASRTLRFTEAHTYEGTQDKTGRIIQGCIAEYVVFDFCKMNSLHCEFREKPDYLADQYDLYLGKKHGLADIKASYIRKLAPQVHRSNSRINIYVFCFLRGWSKLNRRCDWIEIIGWQYANVVTDKKYFIEKGGTAPWAGYEQKFGNGSYFYTDDLIIPESLVTGIVEHISPLNNGDYKETVE